MGYNNFDKVLKTFQAGRENRAEKKAYKEENGMSKNRVTRLKNKVAKIDAKKGTAAGDKSRAMRKLSH